MTDMHNFVCRSLYVRINQRILPMLLLKVCERIIAGKGSCKNLFFFQQRGRTVLKEISAVTLTVLRSPFRNVEGTKFQSTFKSTP